MDTSALPRNRAPAGNTATTWLKIIALVFMFIDHAGKMLFPGIPEMRILGRIAFPIYAWCVIVGFHYTRSVPKYLLRILTVGLISQPLYMISLNHTWSQPNVFLTIFLGLCSLWGIREKKYLSQFWAPAAAVILASVTVLCACGANRRFVNYNAYQQYCRNQLCVIGYLKFFYRKNHPVK